MALIKCKECGKEISSAAAACPNCGKPIPKTSAAATGCLVVIIVIVVLALMGQCSGSDKDLKPPSAQAPAAEPVPHTTAPVPTVAPKAAPVHKAAPAATVATDLNDAKALDEKFGTDAFIHCGVEADDYLREASKFAFKWDEIGFFDQKFDKYRNHVSSPGVLTMVSNKASLQNGFGAYQRIELLCEYDTQAKKVLGYSIR
jgi:hypothetical protein